jgi:hypothetical protein
MSLCYKFLQVVVWAVCLIPSSALSQSFLQFTSGNNSVKYLLRFFIFMTPFWALAQSTSVFFPSGFNCGRLTNEQNRAACYLSQGQRDPTNAVLSSPVPSTNQQQLGFHTNSGSFSPEFPCERLTNAQARVACFLSQGRHDPTTAVTNSPSTAERDRLNLEIQVERRKRQDLEQQLTFIKERDRITAELDDERKKRQEIEVQLVVQQQPLQGPKRNAHALVIGNSAYPGSGRLDNPVNDANAISQKLRSMGFTVTTVTDANRQKLVQSMAQFRRTAAAADISLLFYAGHGVQIFGTNYILPTDVDQTDPAQATIQGVSLNSVVENFLPGKTKLVFLDACRDNALQRTSDRSVSKGLAPISAAEGTLISYATKDGQTAADGAGSKNSPFTQALLEHINDPQDIAVVLRKVREKVMKATGGKQQPWEYGSLTGGELVLSAIKPK